MHNQSYIRRGKLSGDMDSLNHGDVMSLKSSIQSPPQDHGDVKRNKKKSDKSAKKTKPEKKQIHVDLIANLIKTSADCVSVKSENPGKTNLDNQIRSESMDFRKRIKDRYTFKLKNGSNKNEGSKSIYAVQNEVKKEQRPRYETFEKRFRDRTYTRLTEVKRNQNNISIHKAISAIKIKEPIKPKVNKESVEKINESLQTEKIKDVKKTKSRKSDIKSTTSKQNGRVCKAVSFVDEKQPKSLDSRISHKEVKRKTPNRSRLSVLNVATVQMKSPTLTKRRQLSGKRKVTKRAQNANSIDTLPEVAIVPESVNPHTKPYYEAWVNKTLTTKPKYSKKYKDYFDKTKVLQALKEMRRSSSELMHASSEQYAGRIRVRQKSKKEKK